MGATAAAAGGTALLIKGLMHADKTPCTTVVPILGPASTTIVPILVPDNSTMPVLAPARKVALRGKLVHAPTQSTTLFVLPCVVLVVLFSALSCCCLFAAFRKRMKASSTSRT